MWCLRSACADEESDSEAEVVVGTRANGCGDTDDDDDSANDVNAVGGAHCNDAYVEDGRRTSMRVAIQVALSVAIVELGGDKSRWLRWRRCRCPRLRR